MTDGYRTVFGAFPYAFRRSDSLLFKSYVVFGTLAAGLVGSLFLLSLLVWIGETAETPGGSLTLSRTFIVIVGLFAAGPLLAPTLLVARKYRKRLRYHPHYDAVVAALGYLFLLSLYAAAIISMPECFELDGEQVCRDPPSGFFGPVIALLYALPQLAAVAPPLLVSGAIAVAHRFLSQG